MNVPGTSLRVAALIAVLVLGAGAQVDPIATFEPGPHAIGSADWTFGLKGVTEPGTGGAGVLMVEHFGTLRYPAVVDGEGTPVAPGGPYPFLVFAHGRFHSAPYIGNNHKQAGYLLDHLASWGFVVASVNLDVVGQYGTPAAIKQRGELIQHTIDAFELLDPKGWVADFGRIGLIGHSRGGEGTVAAWNKNPQGHAIGAIATIAPTSFAQTAVQGTPYLGLYGSKDGDVNNGWPIHVYDRVHDAPKVFEYVEGANHFWFTETIHFSGEGSAQITREQHHDIARTYITAFMIANLSGQAEPFTELVDGPSLWPITDDIVLHPMYEHPGALVVNDFEDGVDDVNTLGGLSAGHDLLAMDQVDLEDGGSTFYHQTNGLHLGHSLGLGPGAYAEELPDPIDARGYGFVSLRVLQRHGSALNSAGQAQDLKLILLDSDLDLAVRRLSWDGTIPWPITHSGAQFPEKSVLRTTRVALADFVAANPALDLDALAYVALVFDLTVSSDLRLDDLVFTD